MDLISRDDVLRILKSRGAAADMMREEIEALPSALAAPQTSIERLLTDVSSYHPHCNTFNPPSHE